MKKIILFVAVVFTAIFQSCSGRKTEAAAVPEAVIDSFNNRYPGVADLKWESETKNGKIVYGGDFKENGKKREAEFDENGSFLREK